VPKLKVMTIVGTRPEIIRLSRIIARLDEQCEHVLVHTGQNYTHSLNGVFFEELAIRSPDVYLGAAGANAAETIGQVIIETDRVLEAHSPEALLVLGDTNSSLAVIPAKRRKIPIFHMEAGNRCFDSRVPEEINRRIVDHTSDVNLPYSTIARECLLREGLPADLVIKTGSPMYEVIEYYRGAIEGSNVLERLSLRKGDFYLVSAHREENIEPPEALNKITGILNMVAERFRRPIIVSTHPRTQKRIDEARVSFHPLVRLLSPLGFLDYVKLQLSARAVLSDSGTITEEASILGFPAVILRETHERHEAMEEPAVLRAGLDASRVEQILEVLEGRRRDGGMAFRPVADYFAENVSQKIVNIIHSYTGYVNRVVWRNPP
jgi:UDP-N-acetylglucosamine 2-epimerase